MSNDAKSDAVAGIPNTQNETPNGSDGCVTDLPETALYEPRIKEPKTHQSENLQLAPPLRSSLHNESIRYILEMCRELAGMSKNLRLTFVYYYLSMAHAAAWEAFMQDADCKAKGDGKEDLWPSAADWSAKGAFSQNLNHAT